MLNFTYFDVWIRTDAHREKKKRFGRRTKIILYFLIVLQLFTVFDFSNCVFIFLYKCVKYRRTELNFNNSNHSVSELNIIQDGSGFCVENTDSASTQCVGKKSVAGRK